jgi:lysophospholipase L1-like esterase
MILRILIKIFAPLFAGMHKMKADQFEKLPVHPGDIVFLGDSITEGGLWNEWFPDLSTKNRGIDGDTSAGVLERAAVAFGPEPAAVFLLIGTNDLAGGVKADAIVANVAKILELARATNPDVRLVLNSVMPRAKSYRSRIQDLNRMLQQVAEQTDATWLDLWPALQSPDGTLRKDLTEDGLHLNGSGYRAWVDLLKPELARITA